MCLLKFKARFPCKQKKFLGLNFIRILQVQNFNTDGGHKTFIFSVRITFCVSTRFLQLSSHKKEALTYEEFFFLLLWLFEKQTCQKLQSCPSMHCKNGSYQVCSTIHIFSFLQLKMRGLDGSRPFCHP